MLSDVSRLFDVADERRREELHGLARRPLLPVRLRELQLHEVPRHGGYLHADRLAHHRTVLELEDRVVLATTTRGGEQQPKAQKSNKKERVRSDPAWKKDARG